MNKIVELVQSIAVKIGAIPDVDITVNSSGLATAASAATTLAGAATTAATSASALSGAAGTASTTASTLAGTSGTAAAGIDSMGDAAGQAGSEIDAAGNSLENYNSSLEGMDSATSSAEGSMDGLSSSTGSASQSTEKFSESTSKAGTSAESTSKQVTKLQSNIQNVSTIFSSSTNTVTKFTTSLSTTGSIAGGAALTIGATLVSAFEKLVSAVKNATEQVINFYVSGLEKMAEAAAEAAVAVGKTLVTAVEASGEAMVDAAASFVDNGLEALETDAIASATAVAGVTSAVVALTSASVDAYSEYEQIYGGIEKLFGTSSTAMNTITSNANNAWISAGISATDYMEAATSISAILINSVGSYSEAAEWIDQSITQMADNAAAFGTDFSTVEQVYTALAKYNYTTLDNLNLGYAGTKEGMQALIEDANDILEAAGEAADLDESAATYEDMIEAIGIIQEDLGIADTAANEATETVAGSVNSLTAAWENLLTGLADSETTLEEFTGLVDNLIDAFEAVVGNVEPIVEHVIERLPDLISSLGEAVVSLAPSLIDAFADLIINAAEGITDSSSTIVKSLSEVLDSLIDLVVDTSGPILSALLTLMDAAVTKLESPATVSKITSALATLIQNVITYLSYQATMVGDLIDTVLNEASAMITNNQYIETIVTLFTELLEDVGYALKRSNGAITDFVESMLEVFQELCEDGDTMDDLFDAMMYVVEGIAEGLEGNVELLCEAAITLITYLSGYLQESDALSTLTSAAFVVVTTLASNLLEGDNLTLLFNTALEIVLQLVEGITENAGEIMSAANEVVSEFVEWLKEEDNADQIGEAAFELLSTLAGGLMDEDNIFVTIIEAAGLILDSLLQEFQTTQNKGELILGGLDILDTIVSGITNNFQHILDVAGDVVDELFAYFNNPENLDDLLSSGLSIIDEIVQGATDALYLTVDIVTEFCSYILDVFQNPEEYPETWNKVQQLGDAIWDLVLTAIGLGDRVEAQNALEDQMAEAFELDTSELEAQGFSDGSDVADSILSGYSTTLSGDDEVVDQIEALDDDIVSQTKEDFEYNSPSKVFQKIGSYLMEGMAMGIDDTGSEVLTSASNLSSNLIESFEGISVAWDNNVANLDADLATGDISATIMPDLEEMGTASIDADTSAIAVALEDFKNSTGVNLTQNIYSQKQTAAEIFKEARYQQQRLMSATAR